MTLLISDFFISFELDDKVNDADLSFEYKGPLFMQAFFIF